MSSCTGGKILRKNQSLPSPERQDSRPFRSRTKRPPNDEVHRVQAVGRGRAAAGRGPALDVQGRPVSVLDDARLWRDRSGAAGNMRVEWEPKLPGRLTRRELNQYRVGRNALYAKAADAIGGNILLAE